MSSGFQSVLGHKPYSEHADDGELVAIAVKASCTNFAYASERLRDDVEMSRRIKERYMDNDELDRWGDDPNW